MPDCIEIEDLLLRTYIGINPEEQANLQDVVLTIGLVCDLREAGQSDDIDKTVNYRTLTKAVIRHVEEHRFQLVEGLAEQVARLCLAHDQRVERVRVQVRKPGALRFARSVGVTIERSRGDV